MLTCIRGVSSATHFFASLLALVTSKTKQKSVQLTAIQYCDNRNYAWHHFVLLSERRCHINNTYQWYIFSLPTKTWYYRWCYSNWLRTGPQNTSIRHSQGLVTLLRRQQETWVPPRLLVNGYKWPSVEREGSRYTKANTHLCVPPMKIIRCQGMMLHIRGDNDLTVFYLLHISIVNRYKLKCAWS